MQIIFYKKENGNCPVEEFFDSLNAFQMRKTAWTLKVIQELEFVPRQYLKKLDGTDELWEVRVQAGSDKIRILGFIETGKLIILTRGFIKKSEKIPKNEIELATERKKDYKRRFKNE